MRRPTSVATLTKLGREQLSPHFYMREMLYSEVANFHGMQNFPDNPNQAIAAGRRLCTELLEPLRATFGHISVRSAYRSCDVNKFCCKQQKNRKKEKAIPARATTMHAMSGTELIRAGSWGPPLVSPSLGSWIICRSMRTSRGPQWHGGYTTTYLTRNSASSARTARSTSVGTRDRNPRAGSRATVLPVGC